MAPKFLRPKRQDGLRRAPKEWESEYPGGHHGLREGAFVSRRMVKWITITSINPESFTAVEAKVKQPLDPVKSCRVEGLELHITKCYVLASAPPMLGMTLAIANQPIVNFSDEKTQVGT